MPEPQDLWGERARLRPRQGVFDATVAVGFTLVALVAASAQGWLLVVATLSMGLAVGVRRASWPVMAVLALATGVLQVVAGELVVVADAGYAPVCFVLGAHPQSWVRRLGLAGAGASAVVLAVAVGAGAVGDAATSGSTTFTVVASAALATLVAGGGWALGYLRWQNRARISAQVQAGLEQERTRIAADMHDLVAHTWAVVAAQADGARYALDGPDGDRKAAEALDVIADTARGSIADLRDLLAELRYDEPRSSTRDALVARMRSSGMDLRLVEHGDPRPGSTLLLPEALTNALKHGDLTHPVEVEEDWRDGYCLMVRNRLRDGRAGPGTGTGAGTGNGLTGMRERVERAGGRFTASAEGPDWVLRLEVPAP